MTAATGVEARAGRRRHAPRRAGRRRRQGGTDRGRRAGRRDQAAMVEEAGAHEGGRARRRFFRWPRLGLRARVTVVFGAGALLVSASMGGLSYFTARHYLVGERESADLHQAYINAATIRDELRLGAGNLDSLVSAVNSGTDSTSVLLYHQAAYGSSLTANKRAIPTGLRRLVVSGVAATQTLEVNGDPRVVVGVPIPSVHAEYFEIFDLSDVEHTLRVLALALAAAGLVTTLLGAAVGRGASGRSLRPLSSVSRVATAIAGGQLNTRLPHAARDPDLEGLTRSFNQMVDQLQERIEREARFTSDVSHELRSPLTTLSASLEVLERSGDELSDRGRQALTLLGQDLRRFQRMVGDLLEISRSDTGAADLFKEEVSIGELVHHAVSAAARTLPEHHEAPEVVVDAGILGLRLDVDKRRFERVVANLLENASVYGGGATRVTAEAGPELADGRPSVQVAVEDHGSGIAPAERTRVFERFYRGLSSGRRGTGTGTGLGLSLVAEHVRLHGGTVWVDEAPGGGARFVVQLPVEHTPALW